MRLPRINSDQQRWLLACLVVALVIICIGQLLYPRDRLVPFATIDSVSVGGWVQQDATWELDHRLAKQPISITIKQTNQVYGMAKPSEVGLAVSNKTRVEAAGYPLWARLVPTSLVWYQLLYSNSEPEYGRDDKRLSEFIHTTLGDCQLAPKDASITFSDGALKLVEAKSGGTCDKAEVAAKLREVRPTLTQPATVSITATVEQPVVDDESARVLIKTLQERTEGGVIVRVGDKTEEIPQKELFSWLLIAPKDEKLTVEIDETRSNAYFTKNITPLVAVPAGVTRVTTRDFTELSRKTGKSGRTLDAAATRASLLAVLNGKQTSATAVSKTLKPNVSYKRSYTKTATGITAMLTHYDQDNPGVFGVSFAELGGQKRRAAYNQNRVFTTASTYKLFVAFSVLKYIDNGKYEWSDKIVDSRNLSTCFDDMIVKSDNTCAEALLEKVGRERLDSDLRSIGLTRSTFRAATNQTTAAELALFLEKLQSNDLPIKSSSRERLLSAMKRQIYRQGVPSGTKATVADKVGFLNGLLHDAAIIYSPKGTYVLVILSDGSAWANLAEITKRIESLR